MLFQGQYIFNAAPDRVWALLADVKSLTQCVPGCRNVTQQADGRYSLSITLTAPLIGGEYAGTIGLSELDPPRSYCMYINGVGGPGGLRGSGRVTLLAEALGTKVDVRGDATFSGFIAAFGPRLLETATKTGLDKFYGCLQKRIA